MLVTEAWRAVNIIGAGYLFVWAVAVFRIRARGSDELAGHWLATSWGLLMLAVVVGNLYQLDGGFSPSLPIVSAAIVVGVGAQWKAVQR